MDDVKPTSPPICDSEMHKDSSKLEPRPAVVLMKVESAGSYEPPSRLDWYLRSYPLFVTNPRAMSRIILPPDSGSDYPAVRVTLDTVGMVPARVLRLLTLLQSTDRRQIKRGMRLFREEYHRRG